MLCDIPFWYCVFKPEYKVNFVLIRNVIADHVVVGHAPAHMYHFQVYLAQTPREGECLN